MIFISELTISWTLALTIFGIGMMAWWVLLYFEFTIGSREKIDMGKYFRLMFENYRKTELRLPWKVIILVVEYVLAMYALLVIKTAWYLSQGTRWLIGKILFTETQKEK